MNISLKVTLPGMDNGIAIVALMEQMVWFDYLALAISCCALMYMVYDAYSNWKRLKSAETKANKAAELSERYSEARFRKRLRTAKHKFHLARAQYLNSERDHPSGMVNAYKVLVQSYRANLISAYETGCRLYLEGKIDRERFKRDYSMEIKQLVERPDYGYRGYALRITSSTSIAKVYRQWFKGGNGVKEKISLWMG